MTKKKASKATKKKVTKKKVTKKKAVETVNPGVVVNLDALHPSLKLFHENMESLGVTLDDQQVISGCVSTLFSSVFDASSDEAIENLTKVSTALEKGPPKPYLVKAEVTYGVEMRVSARDDNEAQFKAAQLFEENLIEECMDVDVISFDEPDAVTEVEAPETNIISLVEDCRDGDIRMEM
jgi:hypothetical protein